MHYHVCWNLDVCLIFEGKHQQRLFSRKLLFALRKPSPPSCAEISVSWSDSIFWFGMRPWGKDVLWIIRIVRIVWTPCSCICAWIRKHDIGVLIWVNRRLIIHWFWVHVVKSLENLLRKNQTFWGEIVSTVGVICVQDFQSRIRNRILNLFGRWLWTILILIFLIFLG